MKLRKYLMATITIFYIVGCFLHLNCSTREIVLQLTTPFLIVVNAVVLYFLIGGNLKFKLVAFLIFAFVFTVILEIIGSKTGLIFGRYAYGNSMSLKVGGVPIVIGLNWVVLLIAAFNATGYIFRFLFLKSGWGQIIVSSIMLTFLDFLIEPVAVQLDYWNWHNGDIPLQNYLAWFLISMVLLTIARVIKVDISRKILTSYFVLIFSYFALLRVLLTPC